MPDLPKNKFKEALLAGKRQIGLWVTSRDAVATEMLAQTGFDAITIDCEHTTHDIHSVVQALQAMKGTDVSPVVRPPSNDPIFLKRLLDAGVQSFVIPYVQNADEARLAAEAVAYALPRLCPQAIKPQDTPLTLGENWQNTAKAYIRCTNDQTIPPEYQAEMVADWPRDMVHDMHCSHSPFFADPEGLADLIGQIAKDI